jgi:hypothetical protein
MILKRFPSVSGNCYASQVRAGITPKVEVATERRSHAFDEGKAVP